MKSIVAVPGGMQVHEAVDYVGEEAVEEYVTDALTRWQSVEVSDELVEES